FHSHLRSRTNRLAKPISPPGLRTNTPLRGDTGVVNPLTSEPLIVTLKVPAASVTCKRFHFPAGLRTADALVLLSSVHFLGPCVRITSLKVRLTLPSGETFTRAWPSAPSCTRNAHGLLSFVGKRKSTRISTPPYALSVRNASPLPSQISFPSFGCQCFSSSAF